MKAIVQAEASECGLASLAMVASAHGMQLGLPELRRQYHLSLKGIRLNQLVQIAQTLGFSTRPLRLEMEHLGQVALPCILHWDLNHFVVLAKVGKSKATIFDPAIGERRLSLSEVSQHFTGVALELTPTAEFKQYKAAPSISARQLTGPIRGLWSALSHVALLSMALQVFVILAPFYTQWVVDQVLVSADRDLLVVLGLGFGLALLLQVGIGLLRGWSVVSLSSRLGLQWMGNVFAHLLKLPLDFFEKRHLGDVTSRMSSVQTIQHTLTTSFVEAMIDGVMAMVTLVLMLVYSWKLALVTLLAVALYLGIRAIAYRPMRDRTEQQLVAAARQQTHLLESLRGMQSLKVAGEESLRRSTYENLLNDTVNQDVKLARMSLSFSTASQLVFGLERIAVIWIGARLALDNVFSVGMLVAYLAYKDQFATRVSGLIDKWIECRMLRLHGERLADIVLSPPEEQHAQPHALPPTEPSIEVEGLSFRYADGEPWVVKDCCFTIAPGESVAIIGGSGCGKTTLVKLLLGLLTPSEGTIRIGGHGLHKLGPRNVRAMIGVVMQDDQLFAGSIADNISFFDTDFELERTEAAAQLAAVHEDIAAMPMGYHSLIGDMGSSLSGGQRQRIILARALYRQPKLLFLDEATSHLDVTRERLVNEAVKHLQLTKVIVAHRPETIASADRILVMAHGRIVQEVKSQQSPEISCPEDHFLSA
ncbi:peptidase domain-containing ABC transporter [Xanthomonas citri]|uniref:peptidase domain-containing ABC transporter n=1 Tax=Xanthomonas citri TaxID=346 RepID=UPI000247CEAC|nr:peptidase domain-containing ABC transporter [Xanthomonas citri]MBE0315349.1 peptidase domain-containing ABC transporter [Xanthomonas citri pv. punicae]MDS0760681.1 peptidase domain-containing ABC transporter [Xanthomonas citri pv. punicae]MDS0764458.1 peptidase domain-containing ABC transporter [Xanthomonas citri pv. punicae]MDS0799222.1 peptidase domain-containing ABC transporter [Xanthomonas citri pv. punicae]MDS0831862.1 peptidase domain-containing ABC transporter [Xanthomonas citri pv. 